MFKQNSVSAYLQRPGYKHRLRARVIGFCVLVAGILFFGAMRAHGQVDLADAPLFTKINPPPTNIMILLDDSGSMLFSVLVKGRYDGRFPNPAQSQPEKRGFSFLYDAMGDTEGQDSWRFFGAAGRLYWQSQWHETNIMYYNPDTVYQPWENYKSVTFGDADLNTPRIHPVNNFGGGNTLDLDEKSFTVDIDADGNGIADGTLTVPWSHYFVRADNGTVYLVIMERGAISYYTFTTDGAAAPNDKIVMATPVSVPPADIARDYDTERQNFANWFTYARRREFVAKAAIARVLKDPELNNVRVGILGINGRIIIPLKPVKAFIGGVFQDETDSILETLYTYKSSGGTPLKTGLRKVGEYYRVNKGDLEGQKGDAPYPSDGGACQQSFTIIVTDGYYSDEEYTSVGNTDGNSSAPYADWGGGKEPYKDGYDHTLADIAMHYYATDLSPDADDVPKGNGFEDLVPTNKYDGAPHQHMVTFGVAFGVSGTLNPDDYEDDRTSPNYMKSIINGDYVVWPEVVGERQPESIDDLWHATVNGRGVFVNAGQPGELVEGLIRIFKDMKDRKPTSAASVSVNGDWLFANLGPDVSIFQGSYSFKDDIWGGDVKAYPIDQLTGKVLTDPQDLKWSAAVNLQGTAWDSRNILTYDGDTTGLPFQYDRLTSTQKQKLGSDGKAGSAADLAARNTADFIRGKDLSSSGNRSQMMGDIVHSSPVFIDDTVYVGANDGMLHAFNAIDGSELFAYVPNLVFDYLKNLANPDYEHNFYVDLTPSVKKGHELLGGPGDQTMLVGGLGKGGQGYFALDITHPDSMSASDDVLWEFPKEGAPQATKDDMGYSFSKPVIVRSYNSAHPWVVIFGNGYNSKNGKSALFILDAKTGQVIQRIPAGSGPDNGLSSPIAVDVDFDDIVDFIYAGDLHGNLWKFDLTSTKDTEWEVAYKKGAQGVPLFSAIDPAGNPQPITSKPDVMFHPEQHGLIVCFGTGKFLGEDDFSVTQTQTIYGIWDYGDRVFRPGPGWSEDDNKEYLGTFRDPKGTARVSNQPPKVKLLQQVASEVKDGTGEDEVIVRVLTDHQPVWQTIPDPDSNDQLPDPSDNVPNDVGWYLDLDVYAGERVIGDVILRDGILIVIGFIPEQSYCGSGGESVFMELNAFSGGQLAGIQFDIHDDGSVGEDDLVESKVNGKKTKVPPSGKKLPGNIQPPAIIKLDEETEMKYLSSSSGGIIGIAERAAKTGIAYWMEIRR